MIDHPGGIKNHARPVPYGGGFAMVLGTAAALFLHYGLALPHDIRWIIIAASAVFAGGVWDDARPLGVVPKFAIQGLGALILIVNDVRLKIQILPTWLDIALTLLWLVGMANAVNMIDIMDGLAGGVSGIAAVTFGMIGFLFGENDFTVLSFGLAAGIFGFLLFNLHPARIFMGDAGAQFLGFTLGATAIEGAYTTFNSIALLAPVLILGLPLYDTALVSVIRIQRGQSPFRGSADHVALRLRRMGFSLAWTVRLCYLGTALLSIAATAATLVSLEYALWIYATTMMAAILCGFWLGEVEAQP